jgi:hypothetical protein
LAEGKNTEPDYLRAFAVEHGNMLVRVKVLPAVGVPATIVEEALKIASLFHRRRRDSYEDADEIWVMFDCDNHPQVNESIERALSKGLNVAYSNPCFELWALLHFRDHDAPADRRQIQRSLKKHMPKYEMQGAKRIDYELLKGRYDKAYERAARMEKIG